jgi:hypothetical protein
MLRSQGRDWSIIRWIEVGVNNRKTRAKVDDRKAALFRVDNDFFCDAWIHRNDKRPWWRTKRPIHLIRRGTFLVVNNRGLAPIEISNLFIRYEGIEGIWPLADRCSWIPWGKWA